MNPEFLSTFAMERGKREERERKKDQKGEEHMSVAE